MIRRLEAAEAEAQFEALGRLLRDAVLGGASVGFVLPLEPAEIEVYWQGALGVLHEGSRLLLAAFEARPWSVPSSSPWSRAPTAATAPR